MRGLWAGLRGHVIVICALIGCWAWTAPACAQSFPSRPITLVVPFAAGGPTDTLARILSERIAAELHATIVVENVAGASGSIAGARVARATPDGTTITIGHWGTHVLNGAIFKLPYDLLADFEPFRLRWALQHWPYTIAKLVRALMPPAAKRSPVMMHVESEVLKAAGDRLNLI